MLRSLAVGFVSLWILASPIAESEASEFIPTTTVNNDKPGLSLIGKFHSSKTVVLLSGTGSITCKGKTLKAVDYKEYPYDDRNPLRLTPVDTSGCEAPVSQYVLAYPGNVDEYRLLDLVEDKSPSAITHFDRIVRRNSLLKEWEEYPNPSDSISKLPVLYRFSVPALKKIRIVQYLLRSEDDPKGKYGPLFFFVDNRMLKTDSEAVIRQLFRMKGRYFVMYDHRCWAGCGNIYSTLLEIKPDQFKTIFRDATWAD